MTVLARVRVQYEFGSPMATVNLLSHVCKVSAYNVGKPNPRMFRMAYERSGHIGHVMRCAAALDAAHASVECCTRRARRMIARGWRSVPPVVWLMSRVVRGLGGPAVGVVSHATLCVAHDAPGRAPVRLRWHRRRASSAVRRGAPRRPWYV